MNVNAQGVIDYVYEQESIQYHRIRENVMPSLERPQYTSVSDCLLLGDVVGDCCTADRITSSSILAHPAPGPVLGLWP